jgi:hypothetical protein
MTTEGAQMPLERRARAKLRELRAMPREEAHDEYVRLAQDDRELWNQLADRDPQLHARLSLPPPERRTRGTRVASYRLVAGRWVADRIVVDRAPLGCERRARGSHAHRPGHRRRRAGASSRTASADPGEPAGSSPAAPARGRR